METYINEEIVIRRGDVYMAELPEECEGSVQAGRRPVVITQCNALNATSPTVIVAIVTSQLKKTKSPSHVLLPHYKWLSKPSMVAAEQRKTISKNQLVSKCGELDEETMKRVTRALRCSEAPDKKNIYKRKPGKYHKRPNPNKRPKKKHKLPHDDRVPDTFKIG